MRLLLRLAVTAAAVWVAVELVDGLRFTGSLAALAAIAVILGLINAVVRPIVAFFSFPLIILTLGLFILVINTSMLWLTVRISRALELGLDSDGFGATFLGAVVISIVSAIGNAFVRERD